MPLILELPHEIESRLRAIADGRGESLEALALESLSQLAAQTSDEIEKQREQRRDAVNVAYGSLAHLPVGFDFLAEKRAETERENGGAV